MADETADHAAVVRLLGREPAGDFSVVVRRHDGTPAVIENAPLLRDGRPMPTRYWLVDPALRDAVSRLEAAGGVRRAAGAVPEEAVALAHAHYAAERTRLLPPGHVGPSPSGGVGGTRRGVKCLHAHLAWFLAGGEDPVGRWTAEHLDVRADDFVRSGGGGGDAHTPEGPVAAVDCGTNSTRLIVVDPDDGVLDRQMRITRLGEGVDTTHKLAPAAVERTLSVLRDYRRAMDAHGVVRCRAVATSAARDAVNAEEFLGSVTAVVGVPPEILSGDEEGRLSFVGATSRLPADAAGTGPILVVDIGGGSTELVAGASPASDTRTPLDVRSLDVGCVRVSERFLRHDPPMPEEVAQARRSVEKLVTEAAAHLPELASDGLLIGLAGTVSTLACLEYSITEYDRSRVHHSVLERAHVERWLRLLASEDATARLARPGMARGREDVIVGGVLVLAVVMSVFGRQRCLVSEDDILDGLAAGLLGPSA